MRPLDRPGPRMNTKTAPLVFVAMTVVVFAACSSPEEAPPEEAAAPEEVAAALVETVTLERAPFREELQLTGETEPIRSAVLSSQIPGRIVALDVEEGERVEEGARVLRVDTATAVAQRAQLETQAAAIERDITRAEQLYERGIGTVHDIEQMQTNRDLVADQIDALDVSIYQGRMRSPIGGIVVEKLAEVGEYANPGVPLARIVDTSTIVVKVGLPEREIAHVHEGMEVAVTILATGEEYTGTLARIGVEAHPASRTFPLEIHIDNGSGTLRSGMRAQARLVKRDLSDALVIPRDAILQGIDGPEVLVDDGGVAGLRSVVLGPGRGGFVVIESGLDTGDVLVVRGHRLLVQGEAIRTVDLGTCCGAQLDRFLNGGPAALELPADGQLGG